MSCRAEKHAARKAAAQAASDELQGRDSIDSRCAHACYLLSDIGPGERLCISVYLLCWRHS
eukprot:scaffold120463_cov16-Tisochrysis_lutea.AAC.3